MNGWDDLIGRLTQRLEVDEELRLDVARELRLPPGRLRLGVPRRRPEPTAEAAASAAKALGDEGELAEQLWQANRGRIRLRGVLRWTARVTLLPAAVLVTLLLFAYLLGISGYVHAFSAGGGGGDGGPGWPMGPLGRLVCDPYVGVHLTADQRFLLEGDPNARTDLDKAKSIADRWPDNPVYYANYIAHLLSSAGVPHGNRSRAPPSASTRSCSPRPWPPAQGGADRPGQRLLQRRGRLPADPGLQYAARRPLRHVRQADAQGRGPGGAGLHHPDHRPAAIPARAGGVPPCPGQAPLDHTVGGDAASAPRRPGGAHAADPVPKPAGPVVLRARCPAWRMLASWASRWTRTRGCSRRRARSPKRCSSWRMYGVWPPRWAPSPISWSGYWRPRA